MKYKKNTTLGTGIVVALKETGMKKNCCDPSCIHALLLFVWGLLCVNEPLALSALCVAVFGPESHRKPSTAAKEAGEASALPPRGPNKALGRPFFDKHVCRSVLSCRLFCCTYMPVTIPSSDYPLCALPFIFSALLPPSVHFLCSSDIFGTLWC